LFPFRGGLRPARLNIHFISFSIIVVAQLAGGSPPLNDHLRGELTGVPLGLVVAGGFAVGVSGFAVDSDFT